jgi:hypothetical protein
MNAAGITEMGEPKDKQLAVLVGSSLLAAVDRAAEAFCTSRSEVVRQAVLKDLSQRGFAPRPPGHEAWAMPQIVEFEGRRHVFPDDFSQAEISGALSSLPAGRLPKSGRR